MTNKSLRKSDRTRQFIIEQSAPLFNKKGLAATAMSDIMEVTKMAKGGLYGHFESKEALSYAVVDYNLEQLSIGLHQAIAKAVNPKDQLFAFLDFFKSPLHFKVQGGCPLLNFGAEADDTNLVVKEKVKRTIETAQRKAASIIKDGIEKGVFKKSFDAKEFAILMFTIIEGGTLIGRVLGTDGQMAILIKMLKKQIVAESV